MSGTGLVLPQRTPFAARWIAEAFPLLPVEARVALRRRYFGAQIVRESIAHLLETNPPAIRPIRREMGEGMRYLRQFAPDAVAVRADRS